MNIDFSNLGIGEWAVITLSVVVIIWMVAGVMINRLRSQTITAWLVEGFELLGNVDRVSQIGSPASGARFSVSKMGDPLPKVDVVFLLEPRENVFFWLFKKIMGTHDEMNLRGNFKNIPDYELEVGRTTDDEFTRSLTSESDRPYQLVQAAHGLKIGWRGRKDEKILQQLQFFLTQRGSAVKRISLRRREPNLIYRGIIPRMQQQGSAGDFFTDFFGVFKHK